MRHHFHVVCGPEGSGRTSLIPPRQTTAFLYYNVATGTDYQGNPLAKELFQHRCRAMTHQAHQDRLNGFFPQSSTLILDNADSADLRVLFTSRMILSSWCRMTIWIIYRDYRNIHANVWAVADRYYLFRECDAQKVLSAIPPSHRGTNTREIPAKEHPFQWWRISRWRRGHPHEGALGWTRLICVEAPGFRVLRRCIRRRRWRRWIRELLVMGRFARRWKPRALFLTHKAYAPGGRHYFEAEQNWREKTQRLDMNSY